MTAEELDEALADCADEIVGIVLDVLPAGLAAGWQEVLETTDDLQVEPFGPDGWARLLIGGGQLCAVHRDVLDRSCPEGEIMLMVDGRPERLVMERTDVADPG